jgi:hypothetical protein
MLVNGTHGIPAAGKVRNVFQPDAQRFGGLPGGQLVILGPDGDGASEEESVLIHGVP